MSKMSNLDLVLDEMITTGQKMIDAATALKEMFSETAPEMSKVETKTKKKEAPAQEAEVKKYSFQEVRGITASLAGKGKKNLRILKYYYLQSPSMVTMSSYMT